MPRVELTYPDFTHFTTQLAVRISDINYGNHLGHDGMITMLHEARVLFFRSFGYEEWDVDGVGTVLADLAITYKNEAFYGDLLNIDIAVQEIGSKSCQLYYRVTRVCEESDAPRQLLSIAKTGVVFFDFELRKSAPVPKAFIACLDDCV